MAPARACPFRAASRPPAPRSWLVPLYSPFAFASGVIVQTLPQRLALQQFGDHVWRAFIRADVEDRQNVGMVQRRSGQGFLLEAAQPVGVSGKCLRKYFDRDFALKAGVTGAEDLAHPARAQRRDNLVGAKLRAGGQIHWWADYNLAGPRGHWHKGLKSIQ